LPEQLIDTEMTDKKGLKRLEDALQALWDKARRVSDVLLQLKAENKELQSRILGLEVKERSSMEELQRREHDLNEIRTQLAQAQSNGSSLFSKEESEVLKSRLKELISKINSRV
jgi:predicted  nucleic acid-binding Zn-ribbon protein